MGRNSPQRKQPVAPQGGWSTRGKVPRTEEPVKVGGKRPSSLDIDIDEINKRRPVWRFADIDLGGDWNPATITPAALVTLIDKLRSFESMTIGEIFTPGSEHGKRYDPAEMPSAARNRLTEINRDDETEIVRLRCGNKPRLYGFLREHVFHILWWDPEHQVWPTPKRNT